MIHKHNTLERLCSQCHCLIVDLIQLKNVVKCPYLWLSLTNLCLIQKRMEGVSHSHVSIYRLFKPLRSINDSCLQGKNWICPLLKLCLKQTFNISPRESKTKGIRWAAFIISQTLTDPMSKKHKLDPPTTFPTSPQKGQVILGKQIRF